VVRDPAGELGMRAAGDDHEALPRLQAERAADLLLRLERDLRPRQARQRLLNRSAFHLVLP
jgi:hypothetical protein